LTDIDIAPLIKKAYRFLKTANLSYNDGDYDSTASRTYYAMFYIVKAALLTKDINTKSHSSTISAFGQHFIKHNIFSKNIGKLFNEAFEMRLTGDYEFEKEIRKEDITDLLKRAKEFINTIEKYLKDKGFIK